MPIVTSEIFVPGVDQAGVWRVLSDFESYPQIMESVTSVEVLARAENASTSRWRVRLNGTDLTWTEEDVYRPYTSIDFASTEGDLEVFRGSWILAEAETGTKITLEIEFDLGIPSLSEVFDPLGKEAIRSNCVMMLGAIKDNASY